MPKLTPLMVVPIALSACLSVQSASSPHQETMAEWKANLSATRTAIEESYPPTSTPRPPTERPTPPPTRTPTLQRGIGNPSYLDDKGGFRDATFGSSRVGLAGNWRLVTSDPLFETEDYVRDGDDLHVGAAVLDRVEYEFFQGQLTRVTLTATGQNADALYQYFTVAFGKPVPDWNQMAAVVSSPLAGQLRNLWLWKGAKTSLRMFEGWQRSMFFMQDDEISARRDALRETRTPEKERRQEEERKENLRQMEHRGEF